MCHSHTYTHTRRRRQSYNRYITSYALLLPPYYSSYSRSVPLTRAAEPSLQESTRTSRSDPTISLARPGHPQQPPQGLCVVVQCAAHTHLVVPLLLLHQARQARSRRKAPARASIPQSGPLRATTSPYYIFTLTLGTRPIARRAYFKAAKLRPRSLSRAATQPTPPALLLK